MAEENEKIEKEETPPGVDAPVEDKPKPEKEAKQAKKKGDGAEKKGKASKKKGDAKEEIEPSGPLVTPRMLVLFREKVVPQMMKEFGWANPNRVPKIEKVVINIGIGEGSRDIKLIEASTEDVRVITGQQPMITRARKSVAQYKLRTGMPVGLAVTLRGRRMYHFLDKLFNLALPRVRDFQGLNPNSFDGRGNFTMGLKEQLVFPEIDYDKVVKVRGMDISIITSARNDVEAASLLRGLGCPLRS